MKEVHLITVGKLKDKSIESLENDYFKRLKAPKLKIHEVKSYSEDLKKESEDVMKKVADICKDATPYLILMAENGELYDSKKFSKWFYNLVENKQEKIILIIGGAAGHGEQVLKAANAKLSLSSLTYPHKLARLLLVEQLYRAQTIHQGHPYHK
jgi:23S rRNA (pseudouridine1915-N3)-methyltransferase